MRWFAAVVLTPWKGFGGFHGLPQATSSRLGRFSTSILSQEAVPIGPMFRLAVTHPDVQAAGILGDAEALGFLGAHEVEDPGGADGPDDG